MAKINYYPLDENVYWLDKVIGTDFTTKKTKNFTVGDLTNYIIKSIGSYPQDEDMSLEDKLIGTDFTTGDVKSYSLGSIKDFFLTYVEEPPITSISVNGEIITPIDRNVNIIVPDAPIQTISVNGEDVPPVDGNVAIIIPDAPVQSISVNGIVIDPIDGNIDISVPIKTSDLENDTNFVSDVNYIHTDNNFTDELKQAYDNHIVDTNNPHETTASQVGAYTAGETDELLDLKVPYTGATADVNLGTHSIAGSGLKLNTTNPLVVSNPGEIGWNAVDGTADLKLLNNTTLQLGQELHFYGKATEAISNGDVVQFAGAQGNHILIKRARPTEVNVYPEYIIGISTDNISRNSFGYVTWFGKVNDVFTTGWSVGDLLYFDNSNDDVYGKLTNIRPEAPKRTVIVAAVIKPATGTAENGKIIVRPTFGMKLTDLDDVDGTPLTKTGQMLIWDNVRKVHDFTMNVYDVLVIESTTVPSNPISGMEWMDTASGIKYTYIITESGGQWVETGAAGIGSVITVKRYDSVAPYKYFGVAPSGSLETDSTWKITRIVLNSNGSTTKAYAYPVKWSDRLTIIYS